MAGHAPAILIARHHSVRRHRDFRIDVEVVVADREREDLVVRVLVGAAEPVRMRDVLDPGDLRDACLQALWRSGVTAADVWKA